MAVLVCICASGSLFAQKVDDKVADKPKYDADLAKKLGADPYGMKNYVFVILKTGPADANFKG